MLPWRMGYTTGTSHARDHEGTFRIGIAVSDKPEGPFKPEPKPIEESYTIDPATFVGENDEA